MATENLEINIGANTQDLQNGLNQATQSVTNFGNALKSASKPTGDATQSLINLSRIAQDAPYGFIGIANNLNPMLESFQRLQEETKNSGGALKAMVAGLTGPAGIGLALGVVSSLLVKFGGDLSNLISELVSGDPNFKSYKSSLEGIGSEFTSAAEKVNKVEIAFQEYHKGILTGNQALKIYNDELGKNFGVKSNINDAEETFRNKTAAYVEASLQRALADSASKKAAEELLKQKITQAEGPQTKLTDYFVFFNPEGSAQQNAKQRNYDQINQSEKLIQQYKKIALDAQSVADLYAKGFDFNLSPDKEKKSKKSEVEKIVENLKETERSLDYQLSKGMINELPEGKNKKSYYTEKIDAISDSIKKLAGLTSTEAKKALGELETELSKVKLDESRLRGERFGKDVDKVMAERTISPENLQKGIKHAEDAGAKDRYEQDQKRIKYLDKELEKAQKQAESFAKTLSGSLTNGIMGMWDAMEKGENVMDAFSNFLKDLVKQLAAAVIQALLFKAIMSAISPVGAIGSVGGLAGGVGNLLGFAEGGIVSRPTIAMVGEGGQSEAIMPLNKLGNMMNSTFNAGAMSGQGGGGNGQFVLKGNDLVLALNRSNYSLNLRRGA